MSKRTIEEQIAQSIALSKEKVFLRKDFNKYGSYPQVGRALNNILKKGQLVKGGYGIYVKARKSSLTGNYIPIISIIEIGLHALHKLGVSAKLGNSHNEYLAGKTTQMPMAAVINVGKSRITRRIGFGKKSVRYER